MGLHHILHLVFIFKLSPFPHALLKFYTTRRFFKIGPIITCKICTHIKGFNRNENKGDEFRIGAITNTTKQIIQLSVKTKFKETSKFSFNLLYLMMNSYISYLTVKKIKFSPLYHHILSFFDL